MASCSSESSKPGAAAFPEDVAAKAIADYGRNVAWVDARVPYGPSEVFRFYDGPIDNPETGPEGRINAWPLDELEIDYTRDTPDSGLVNDLSIADLTKDLIAEENEKKGEKADHERLARDRVSPLGSRRREAGYRLEGEPTLTQAARQQSADAFLGDMGLTSSLFPNEECTAAQVDCKAARSGGSPELSDALLASVVTYSHLLAVPARRHWKDSVVRRGKDLFGRAGCTGCHLLTSASSGPPCTSASSSRPSTSVASRPASCSRAPPTSCTGRPSPTPSRDPTPSARPSGSIRSCR